MNHLTFNPFKENYAMDLSNYVKSGYPLLYVETFEINRACESIKTNESINLLRWNCIDGFIELDNKCESVDEFIPFCKSITNTLIIAENFNFFFENEQVIQMLLCAIPILKSQNVTICIIGAMHPKKFPSELKKCIHCIEF